MILNSPYITGSITVTGNANIQGQLTVTGSLSGTAATASFALTLGGTGSVGFATTSSVATASGSVSSRLTQIEQVYATTGSNSFRATQSITGSLTVTGQIIAQTINVQQVTSSIVYSSGSNVFGCDINSRQTFTGSFYQTGSVSAFYSCVGIGTNNPSKKLHISGSGNNSGITFDVDTANPIIRGNTTSNFDLNNEGSGGCIRLYGSAIQFRTNVADPAVVINNGGCMGINCTAPSGILTVGGQNNQIHIRGGYYASIYGYSGDTNVYGLYSSCIATFLNARSGDGLYLGGSISAPANGNHLFINCNGVACFYNTVCAPKLVSSFNADGDNMADFLNNHSGAYTYNPGGVIIRSSEANSCTNISNGSGALIIRNGASTYTAGISYSGLGYLCSGLKFGNGSSCLNYYEEGRWCIYACGSSSGAGAVGEGSYTRVGRLVTATVYINSQTFPSYSGVLRLSLPYTAGSGGGISGNLAWTGGTVYFYPFSAWCSGTNFTSLDATVLNSTNYAVLALGNVNGDRQGSVSSNNTATSGAGGLYLRFTITYEA